MQIRRKDTAFLRDMQILEIENVEKMKIER